MAGGSPVLRALIDAFDWSVTPLGPRDRWSAPLHIAVDLVLGSGHAMCLVWGEQQTLLYNDAYAPFLGKRHPAALGGTFKAAWPELWDDLAPMVAQVFAGETVSFDDFPLTMTRNGYPEQAWWSFSYSPVRDEQAAVVGLLNVASERTSQIKAEKERDEIAQRLREREEFLSGVFAASTDCIKVVELDGSISFMSEGGQHIMDVPDFALIAGCSWPDFLKGDGVERARVSIEAAKQGRSSSFEAEADTYAGTPKHWSISVSPIFDADGAVVRLLSVSRDHTEFHRTREQQALLNAELGHRLKNILSLVQGLAHQTLREVTDVAAASAALSARLVSLGKATDVLTSSSWNPAQLADVIEAGLSAFAQERPRISLSGPEVRLNAQMALSLALTLHELMTNAVKYGALKDQAGSVSLTWRIDGDGTDQRFHLRWEEMGGPAVDDPTRRGFGSRMIERMVRSTFGGDVSWVFPSTGVVFTIDAPWNRSDAAVAQAEVVPPE